MGTVEVSPMDHEHLRRIRESVDGWIARGAALLDRPGVRVLDIAPQVHAGARAHFVQAEVRTLDIDPASGADYVADLCADNSSHVPADAFDVVVCTEVLEHTLEPFAAVREIHRVLRPGGSVLVTVPFNFRIHGPLPDCWRFTVHGLERIFRIFVDVCVEAEDTPGRPLMPIHYRLRARKSGADRR